MIVSPQLIRIIQPIGEIENPIFSRLGYLCSTPLLILVGVADSIIAAGACAATIISLGKVRNIADFAFRQAEAAAQTGGYSFLSLRAAINPKSIKECKGASPSLITQALKDCLIRKIPLENAIIKRVGFAILLPALLISRIADFALGIIFAVRSIFVFEEKNDWIQYAFDQLSSFNILGDITFCVIKIINPSTILTSF